MTTPRDLLDHDQCCVFLYSLGCAEDDAPGHGKGGYGQWWKSANGSAFFVQMDEASGKVVGWSFARIMTQLMRTNRTDH